MRSWLLLHRYNYHYLLLPLLLLHYDYCVYHPKCVSLFVNSPDILNLSDFL